MTVFLKGMIKTMNAYERVTEARKGTRPMGKFYIQNMLDDFIELHGDRRYGDDGAIMAGIGLLNGMPVTVVAMERGDALEERMRRKFGCPSPEGYRKALRLMKQAEKFNRPVLCLIGSSGAYCGIDAEERGQGQAIAENLMEMMTLKTPVISVVLGEGGSGGALALGVADRVWMLENSVYSVISPEGCASILWKDGAQAPTAANCLKLTAQDLHSFGIVEEVLPEAGKTYEQISGELKTKLTLAFAELRSLSAEEMLEKRYQRFRAFGSI